MFTAFVQQILPDVDNICYYGINFERRITETRFAGAAVAQPGSDEKFAELRIFSQTR